MNFELGQYQLYWCNSLLPLKMPQSIGMMDIEIELIEIQFQIFLLHKAQHMRIQISNIQINFILVWKPAWKLFNLSWPKIRASNIPQISFFFIHE